MELIAGCRNQAELQRIQEFVGCFTVAWPPEAMFVYAADLLAQHRLAHGLSIPDCLIAAMEVMRSATLYTFNLKHFGCITGLNAQPPYARGQQRIIVCI
jgi:hypothetical protein